MKQANSNLESALTKHLAPAKAPPNLGNDLWQRVNSPRAAAPSAQTRPQWTQWAAAAAILAIVAGGSWMWSVRHHGESVETLAVAALGHNQPQLGLISDDAAQVRKWIKQESGIDVPLPPRHSDQVQIIGARVSEARLADESQAVAEISYQVGEYRAALLVTKDPTGVKTYPSHDARSSDPFQTARVSSWSMRGQSYTLAWAAPGEFRTACLLCHATEPSRTQMPAL